jgi:hypothetical protein
MRSRSRSTRSKPRCQLLLTRRQLPPIQRSIEQLQCRNRLIKGDLMSRFIHPSEREVAILASLSIFHSVNEERRIAGGLELFAVLVLGCEGDGLAAEPVADVVGVAVDKGNAHRPGQDVFQVFEEVGPDKVSGLLECEVDLVVGFGVV